ncbi:uncharacterized protein LOC121373075 [Gigantopelta aegis]|uniref:uncharacterized protein LOC121373075 n=1 Tax=Gigantopelta aegis TaxID=1735272 RepID=UPI001B88C5FE|nr:uncharacterized protein LOC121373075 [Gigantopelta aegis]
MSSARYRQRRVLIPALPQTRADVILEEPWTQTNDGRRYLLFSDGNEDNMLVFSTDEQIVALQAAESIFMDGTFSSCPALWNQLYIIHDMDGTTMYPLVFALLPDKQRITYIRLFSLLKNEVQQLLNQPLAPSKVQTDFEMAAIQAVETEFPQAEVKGCFFTLHRPFGGKLKNWVLLFCTKKIQLYRHGFGGLLDYHFCPLHKYRMHG